MLTVPLDDQNQVSQWNRLTSTALSAENDRLTKRVEEVKATLRKIADAPAWGYPERWETTPAEVRILARTTLGERP
jgi:hypothetical protein